MLDWKAPLDRPAIVGDERLLAERLGVNPQQVLDWTNGIEPVPSAIFLKIVDVVVTSTPEDIRRSRQVLTNASRGNSTA